MTERSFKEAYGVLQQHAQTLRDQQEPNIDDLLNIVTQSVDAYKVCQERIEAVEKALEKALGETARPGEDAKRSPAPAAPVSGELDDGDDIPF